MNHTLPPIIHPALKQSLSIRLQTALRLYVANSVILNQLEWHLSLNRAKDEHQVLYVSAIALQLSKIMNITALEIATAIARQLSSCDYSSPDDALGNNFTVRVVPPGWIHLHIHEQVVATWLQRLAQQGAGTKELGAGEQGSRGAGEQGSRGEERISLPLPLCPSAHHPITPSPHHPITPSPHHPTPLSPSPAPRSPLPAPSHLFAVQYAHARCCSLVRMAHREGLIKLSNSPNTSRRVFVLYAPDPIPWLDSKGQLCLIHQSERALIAQLLELLDNIYCPSPSRQLIKWEKAALFLSQAFQTFYSSERIWGEVKIQTPSLAQARLGLIMATKSVLRLLLEDLFGICAPVEL